MAGIDKTYMSTKQMHQYVQWCIKHRYEIIEETGAEPPQIYTGAEGEWIINTSPSMDSYTWDNCPLDFMQARLREQYAERPDNDYLDLIEYALDKIGRVKLRELLEVVEAVEGYHFNDSLNFVIDSRRDALMHTKRYRFFNRVSLLIDSIIDGLVEVRRRLL